MMEMVHAALRAASAKLELPSQDEGFDQLFLVRMDGKDGFFSAPLL
jgi:hypothetical protein